MGSLLGSSSGWRTLGDREASEAHREIGKLRRWLGSGWRGFNSRFAGLRVNR
jgi:hypothetical protein